MNFFIIIAVFLVLSPVVNGLSCTAQYQCSSVSTDYNYVQCVSGQCQCLKSNGFNGTATTSDPCRCDYTVAWGGSPSQPYCKICNPPRYIDYYAGMPYCVNAAQCEALETENDTDAIMEYVVTQVYERLLYPTPIAIMEEGEAAVADLFSPNVQGRVSPVGSFSDFTSVQEYFYGLGAASKITKVTIEKMAVLGNYVSIWVVLFFDNSAQGTPSYNLTQTGFFTFDNTNHIVSMDLDILNLGWALDGDSATNATTRNNIINGVCTTLVVSPGFCPPSADPTGYYSNFTDCVNFMQSITYGTWAHANSNTVICRSLHTILTAFRPDVHCPHAGKTGGMKCVDTPYSSFYDETF